MFTDRVNQPLAQTVNNLWGAPSTSTRTPSVQSFDLFTDMLAREAIDPAHAFYLGYEMAKAVTALTLGKNYEQDQALRWGFLTVPERRHRGTMNEEAPAPNEDPS